MSSTAARRFSSRRARRHARPSFSALLEPGQTVALAEGAYYGTGGMLDELARWGVRKIEFDQTGPPPAGVDLVWLEAPSNPFLTMPDFEAAAAHPARVVCDATAATPVHLRPLELGCDVVVHSATKFLAGHDDALDRRAWPASATRTPSGYSSSGREPAPSRMRTPPGSCYAGCETLEVRVARQTASARVIPERLEAHPAVEVVRYPGFRRATLVRRRGCRGSATCRDRHDADRQHDEPRRRHVAHRGSRPLGGRACARPGFSGSRSGSRIPTRSGQTSKRRSRRLESWASSTASATKGGRRSPQEADALAIRQLAGRGADLAQPRHVIHFLYFADEGDARSAAELARDSGWDVAVEAPGERVKDWTVRADATRVVSSATVGSFRAWFEGVAAEHRGEYDGWEASAKP